MAIDKKSRRKRIHRGIRKRVSGSPEKPRLAVYRSNKGIYAQIIDDVNGVTLCGASSLIKEIQSADGSKTDKSKLVGQMVAERAKEKGISTVVFDRGGFKYHGRVKALAEGAREGGLEF